MKKLFILGICLFIFMIAPNVEAKEYNVTDIAAPMEEENTTKVESLLVGDYVSYDKENEIIEVWSLEIYDGYYDDYLYYPPIENYDDEEVPERYVIKSYEEVTGREIPSGKKAVITMEIDISCYRFVDMDINYSLVDDIPKEVVYHNTYDAENNNPTSYYVEETDILLKDISRDGYKFLGWYTSPDFEEDTRVTMITSDEPDVLNLYAKWERIDTINEETFTNPNTSSMFYIAIGIGFILILGTAIVIVYKYKKL